MKIATGKAIPGEAPVDLSLEQEAELAVSIAQAERGETVSVEEVLEGLARRRGEPVA